MSKVSPCPQRDCNLDKETEVHKLKTAEGRL